MTLQNICIYCSAASNLDPAYQEAATDTAKILAQHHKHIIYGGAHIGLMGIVADTALQNGAKVTGVIPENLKDRELAHDGLTKLHITPDLQTRQKMMADLSDAFIILPGGLGTMAEFFEIVTWKALGYHAKPIIFLNVKNYWDPLLVTLENAQQQGFFHNSDPDLFSIINTPQDIMSVF